MGDQSTRSTAQLHPEAPVTPSVTAPCGSAAPSFQLCSRDRSQYSKKPTTSWFCRRVFQAGACLPRGSGW